MGEESIFSVHLGGGFQDFFSKEKKASKFIDASKEVFHAGTDSQGSAELGTSGEKKILLRDLQLLSPISKSLCISGHKTHNFSPLPISPDLLKL